MESGDESSLSSTHHSAARPEATQRTRASIRARLRHSGGESQNMTNSGRKPSTATAATSVRSSSGERLGGHRRLRCSLPVRDCDSRSSRRGQDRVVPVPRMLRHTGIESRQSPQHLYEQCSARRGGWEPEPRPDVRRTLGATIPVKTTRIAANVSNGLQRRTQVGRSRRTL